MRKFNIIAILLLVIFLSGCVEKVEQKTITCSAHYFDEDIVVVAQKNRIMSMTFDGETLTREENLADIKFVEEMWNDAVDVEDFFELLDELKDEIEADGDALCVITTEEVDFVKDPDVDDESQIPSNIEKDAILADALQFENAAKLYCAQTTCDADQQLTWTQLEPYIMGIDETYYDFTNNSGIVVTKTTEGWTVDLETAGIGELEFTQDLIPSDCDRECVIIDVD